MKTKKLTLYIISALFLCAMSIGFASPTPSPTPRKTAKTSNGMELPNVKEFVIYGPWPDYPYAARALRHTGSGVAILTVNKASGRVTMVTMAQSTGSQILDEAARSAFWKWRFQPGTVAKVKMPVTFTWH